MSEPALLNHESPKGAPALVRSMGLFALIVYGVGDMVGAGIYGTVGVAAQTMGNAVWLAFVASMVAAMLTGLSYACIASRYPRAAGAAYVTQRAFHIGFLSYVVGLTVTASGLTSMATSSNVFAKNLNGVMPSLPVWPILLAFIGILTFVNFWGIRESMWVNILCTTVEVAGLLFVIAVGMKYWGSVDYLETPPPPEGMESAPFTMLILSGAVLTFFSFLGFEDMLNVAEEVKNPVRTMPRGIIIALLIATVLYITVSITAVSVVNYRDLGNTKLGAPLVQITNRAAPWLPSGIYTGITLFAVANTALLNYVMGSRMLYGMSCQGMLPRILGKVHTTRCTPHIAILVLMVIVIALALVRDISQLASATALLLLTCFMVVNAALIVLKMRKNEPKGAFEVPWIVPLLGTIVCGALITVRIITTEAGWKAPAVAGALIVGIALLYVILRPKNITEEALAAAEEET